MTGERRPALRDGAALAFAALCSVLALLPASTSSPLYVTNFWTDTNIYFTIGRGLLRGLMPYRDLFDHKGPLLYLLYGAGAAIQSNGFMGVFLLEALGLAVALRLAMALARELGAKRWAWLLPPLGAAFTTLCRAFTQGGSAEEFALSALVAGILLAWQLMRQRRFSAVLFGGCVAWVFLIKYTDCGLFFGMGGFALLALWRRGGFQAALRALGGMALGFAVPVTLVALWLAANGALGICIDVYFVQNLTGYGETRMTLWAHLWNALAYLRTQSQANPILAGLTALGLLGWPLAAFLRRERGWALALPAGCGLLLLFCYWGEMAHPYYALVFAATALAGLAMLLAGLERLLPRRLPAALAVALPVALSALLLPLGLRFSQAAPLRAVAREDMPQTRFAREMRDLSDAPTLLDLTSLDQGFYLAADVLPTCRYFADNNLDTDEKKEAIASYLADRRCEFLITVWRDIPEGYEVIDRAEGVFDLNDWRTYTLWRRTE